MSKKLDKLSKEELIEYIQGLRKQLNNEKYGLYFDRRATPEDIVEECKTKIPLLIRHQSNDIHNNGLENIIIEGDNFQSLVSLNMMQSDPFIDLVYIDPPYNTKNKEFIYNDDRIDTEDDFRHTKWLNFMEKRLLLVKKIMKDDALIFISIDDNEQAQLKMLLDAIFGEDNFVTTFIIDKTAQGANQSSTFKTQHEFLHCYAKNIYEANVDYEFETERDKAKFKFKDEKGWYAVTNAFDSINSPLTSNKNRGYTVYYNPEIKEAKIKDEYDSENNKFLSYDKQLIDDGFIPIRPGIRKGVQYPWNWVSQRFLDTYKQELVFRKNREGNWRIYHKNRFSGKVKDTSIKKFDTRKYGNQHLVNVLGKKKFDYPKSIDMMKWVVSKVDSKDIVVLDFFAGSGTTGEAVLELNNEDQGNRRFILINNNEGNIMTDVCYPRIKTVVTGIRQDGSKYSDGIPANVRYFKAEFLEDHISKDQAKYNLVEKCDGLLCIKEETFEHISQNNKFNIYSNSNKTKTTSIFNDFFDKKDFENMIQKIKKANIDENVIYYFSLDNNVDKSLEELVIKEIPNAIVKPIPSKIYEIYKKISDDLRREY